LTNISCEIDLKLLSIIAEKQKIFLAYLRQNNAVDKEKYRFFC